MVGSNIYDNAGRPTSIGYVKNATSLANFAYGRSTGGDVTTETTSVGSNKTYTYNTLGQLATENAGSFDYDDADNLTKLADGSTLSYDNANQVLSKIPTTGPSTSYGYDIKGNRTSSTTNGSTTTLGYDQPNRLTSYGSNASYAYDFRGLRTAKTVNSTTSNFVYDTAQGLPLVIDDGTNAYIYGPGGMVIEQVSGSTTTYLHQDQLGSTRLLTNSAGATAGTYQFDAYGTTQSHTGTATIPMLYAGQYQDTESGLYWMRARYYDPSTGQFVSRDPIVAMTRSAYAYVGGDVLNATDATGLVGGPDWKQVDTKYLKRNGIDPHDIKERQVLALTRPTPTTPLDNWPRRTPATSATTMPTT